jgi:hypothetical protein
MITSKMEVPVGLLEGDLVHREVKLLEVVQVSAKRTIAHQKEEAPGSIIAQSGL